MCGHGTAIARSLGRERPPRRVSLWCSGQASPVVRDHAPPAVRPRAPKPADPSHPEERMQGVPSVYGLIGEQLVRAEDVRPLHHAPEGRERPREPVRPWATSKALYAGGLPGRAGDRPALEGAELFRDARAPQVLPPVPCARSMAFSGGESRGRRASPRGRPSRRRFGGSQNRSFSHRSRGPPAACERGHSRAYPS